MGTRIAIGMIVYNEQDMLFRLLYRHVHLFDGLVAIDTGSKDNSVDILTKAGAIVEKRQWKDFSTARNQAIELAEAHGFNQMFILDADESLMESEIKYLRSLSPNQPYILPRYEFISESLINSTFYPDLHVRVFPLNKGYHYRGSVHENVFIGDDNLLLKAIGVKLPNVHIYHYGKLKAPSDIALKYHNFCRCQQGVSRVDFTDVTVPLSYSEGPEVPFHGEHPLCK